MQHNENSRVKIPALVHCSTEFIVYRPKINWTRPFCYAVLNSDAFLPICQERRQHPQVVDNASSQM